MNAAQNSNHLEISGPYSSTKPCGFCNNSIYGRIYSILFQQYINTTLNQVGPSRIKSQYYICTHSNRRTYVFWKSKEALWFPPSLPISSFLALFAPSIHPTLYLQDLLTYSLPAICTVYLIAFKATYPLPSGYRIYRGRGGVKSLTDGRTVDRIK